MLYVRIKEDDIVIKGICFLLLLLLFPSNTKAVFEVIDARCTNSLKTSLREEAQEFTYRLSKVENDNEIVYTTYFYNLSENIDLIDQNGNKYNRTELNNLKQGTTVTISLVASNNTYCEGYKMMTKVIKVPYYNKYYGTDLCKGYENFSLCGENERVLYNENEFEKELENYKESLKTKEEEPKEEVVIEEEENSYMILYEYRYYIIASVAIIFVGITIYIIINKQKNKGIL